MKFLIIRFSSIGDIVLTTPVIRCLKKQVPDAEVHFLTRQSFRGMLEPNPYIDKIHILADSVELMLHELKTEEYDYIIQDRGILSGISYGHACGNTHLFLAQLASEVCRSFKGDWHDLYDKVIYLKNDAVAGLERAKLAKQEFAAGDAIEAKGDEFMLRVAKDMDGMVHAFPHCTINIEGKTVEENFNEILRNIGLGE